LDLKKAHIKEKPDEFVKKCFGVSMMLSIFLTITSFFFLEVFGKPVLHLVWLFFAYFIASFVMMIKSPTVQIRKREKEINKEVLFAGRFILVKIESGEPFYNALVDASKMQGKAGAYFKEIVDQVELGTPIEQALDNAIEYSPSERFRRILWQMNNSLRTGVDIGDTLRSVLNQITAEQVIEIKEYGKKLNSIAMFYMLMGVVVPALGTTMFIIISSFIKIQIQMQYLIFALFMLAFLQFIFITIFKSIRPTVQI